MLDASPRDEPKVLLFEGEELASRSKTEMISPIPPCAVRHRQTVFLVARGGDFGSQRCYPTLLPLNC